MALAITKENFHKEVLEANVPVLVDFWAPWCGPCRMLAPVIDELAQEGAASGLFKVVKADTDQNMELAEQFNIMSIPTLIVFKNGKPVKSAVGALPKAEILNLLK